MEHEIPPANIFYEDCQNFATSDLIILCWQPVSQSRHRLLTDLMIILTFAISHEPFTPPFYSNFTLHERRNDSSEITFKTFPIQGSFG